MAIFIKHLAYARPNSSLNTGWRFNGEQVRPFPDVKQSVAQDKKPLLSAQSSRSVKYLREFGQVGDVAR